MRMQHIIAPNIEYVLIIMSDGLEVKSISDILAKYSIHLCYVNIYTATRQIIIETSGAN